MSVEKSLQKTLLQVKDWAHHSRHCIHFLSQTYFLLPKRDTNGSKSPRFILTLKVKLLKHAATAGASAKLVIRAPFLVGEERQ